ncbi:MAG: hypothetical protein J6866_03455 [Victivallales bacterium]|nr:hypothetical protein [Victivallales bacterium]
MSGATWLLLNLILAVAAGVTTVGMRKLSHTKLPDYKLEEKDEKQGNASKPDTQQARTQRPAPKPPTAASDDIWQKTLFRPDRAEEIATADEQQPQNQVDAQQANADFELVGIARIGLPDKAVPVAIINQKNARNRGGRNMAPGPRGGRPGRPQPNAPATNNAPPVKLKHTFKVGDVINQSGYTLTEINVEAKSVVLTRNAERLTLAITMGDDKSRQRKDASVNARLELQKQRERRDAEARAAQNKGKETKETEEANAGQARPQDAKATPKGDPGNNPPPPPNFPGRQGNSGPPAFNRGANRPGGGFRGGTARSGSSAAANSGNRPDAQR